MKDRKNINIYSCIKLVLNFPKGNYIHIPHVMSLKMQVFTSSVLL